MKCKMCGGTGVIQGQAPGLVSCCPACEGKGFIEMTNEEWLRQCTTEQLAEWICSVHEKCYYCGAKRISDRERCPFGDGKCRNNKHEFAMWLKQPHTESVTNCNE